MVRIMGYVAACAAGALLAGTSALWAQGACPAGIARDGVWVDFPDRAVLSRVLSDGRIHEMEFGHDGSFLNVYVTNALGLVEQSWSLTNGYAPADQIERLTYAGTPATMPLPAPGVRFDGMVTSAFGDLAPTRSSINVVVGPAQPVVIGGCSYTGSPVEVVRVEMGGGTPQRDSMMHLSELGLTIYLGFAEGTSPAENALPLSISLDPPSGVAVGTGAGVVPGIAPPPLPGVAAPDERK